MRITKIFTPLEKAAMSLFKETTGNDLGKRYPYLTDGINQDIFVSGNKTKKIKNHLRSVTRRKW